MYTSTHSEGFELTKLTYTRLEDNLTHHRGDNTAPARLVRGPRRRRHRKAPLEAACIEARFYAFWSHQSKKTFFFGACFKCNLVVNLSHKKKTREQNKSERSV